MTSTKSLNHQANINSLVPLRLRVVHIISNLGIGGAERALLRLVEDTHDVIEHVVICMTDITTLLPLFESAGAQVRVIPGRRGRISPSQSIALTKAIIAAKPDVIHAWMWHACAMWAVCRLHPKIRSIPCVFGIRASIENLEAHAWSSKFALRVSKFVSAKCNLIVYNSERARCDHESFGFHHGNGAMLHNGVEAPQHEWIASRRAAVRAQLAIGPDEFIFMQLGRGHPDKGVVEFLQAAVDVRLTHPMARFVRVGSKAIAHGRGLSTARAEEAEWLIHADSQPDSLEWLAAADACVMSSRRESCPNVVLEAMSVGTPVIATDVGDARLLVGNAGWIVPPQDEKSLANAMRHAMAISESELRAVGAAGRQRVIEHFRREIVAQKYVQIYRDLSLERQGAERRV